LSYYSIQRIEKPIGTHYDFGHMPLPNVIGHSLRRKASQVFLEKCFPYIESIIKTANDVFINLGS